MFSYERKKIYMLNTIIQNNNKKKDGSLLNTIILLYLSITAGSCLFYFDFDFTIYNVFQFPNQISLFNFKEKRM